MNKLDELFKPKITKDEAVTLLKIIYRRFKEITEQHKQPCFIVKRKWQETVRFLELALNVRIELDIADCVKVMIYNVKPEVEDEILAELAGVKIQSLKLVSKVYSIHDPLEEIEYHYFEWCTKSELEVDSQ